MWSSAGATDNESALHHAARQGLIEVTKHLLEQGADPNAKDAKGRTPLHSAIACDRYHEFHILLRSRATDIDSKSVPPHTLVVFSLTHPYKGIEEGVMTQKIMLSLSEKKNSFPTYFSALRNSNK